MEISELLLALLQIPPDLKHVREQLETGQYSAQQVTELGRQFAEECWAADLDSADGGFYSEEFDYSWREPEAIPGRNSFYLYEVFDLLLKFGLDPNYTIPGDYGIMDYIIHTVNGYIAADTLKLLLDHGGDPKRVSDGDSIFDQICFDVNFDAIEQTNRRRYDSLIHCWMILLAYSGTTTDNGGPVDIFNEYSDNITIPFDLKKLSDHRNYYVGITHNPQIITHIFDKRTYWEIARF